jgi:hypothetical protein
MGRLLIQNYITLCALQIVRVEDSSFLYLQAGVLHRYVLAVLEWNWAMCRAVLFNALLKSFPMKTTQLMCRKYLYSFYIKIIHKISISIG